MVKFIDGPANGAELSLRRAPKYLRVVVGINGLVDALDQKEDKPTKEESVHAYIQCWRSYHFGWMCTRNSGCFIVGDFNYKFMSEQPSDEVIRDLSSWEQWVESYDNQSSN